MDWKTRLLLVLPIVLASNAYADDPYSKLGEACLKEKNIYLCQEAAALRDNTEYEINRKLIQWGIFNTAIMFGSMLKVATEKKLEIIDKPKNQMFGAERKFVLSPTEIAITIAWPLD